MNKKPKIYENIFAKLADDHNKCAVPILRKLNLSSIRLRNTRILKLRDILETSDDLRLSIDLLTEYLATNVFVLSLLPKEQIDDCYNLIQSKCKENVIIAANCIYNLVEEKKLELIKLNNG